MPAVVLRLVLWEVADVVEQVYTIALTENLHPDLEDRHAATADYRLSTTRMQLEMRSDITAMAEVRERAQVIVLMRLNGRRWRVWDFEGRRPGSAAELPAGNHQA